MVPLKPPPNAVGMKTEFPQVVVLPPTSRIFVQSREKLPQPLGRASARLHGPAPPARSISGVQRVPGGGEELDVLRLWLSRRTYGTAEDAGGPDAGEEDPVVRRVPALEGVHHFGVRR